MLTRQEIFDTAYKGLVAQGHRAYDNGKQQCMYRGPNGTKCAIGMIMTDEEYKPFMDTDAGGSVKNLSWKDMLPARFAEFVKDDAENLYFLDALQAAHDRWYSDDLSSLHQRFNDVAGEWNLKMPEDK